MKLRGSRGYSLLVDTGFERDAAAATAAMLRTEINETLNIIIKI